MTKEELLKSWNKGILRGTQAKLAKILEVSTPTVSEWFSGKKSPSSENLKKMAKLFKISEKDLEAVFNVQTKADGVQTWAAYPIKAYVPLLGEVKANRFNCIVCENEPELFLPVLKGGDKDYALKVSGDCMEPDIKDGVIIIIRPCVITEVREGEIVVARMGDECTLKRFYTKGNTIWLVPDNNAYKPISGTINDIEITGKVVDVYDPPKRRKRPAFLDEK